MSHTHRKRTHLECQSLPPTAHPCSCLIPPSPRELPSWYPPVWTKHNLPQTSCGLWPLICSTSLCGQLQLWPSVVRLGEEDPRPGSRCARAGLREKSCSVGRSREDHGLLRGDVAFPLDCVGSQSCLFGRWLGWGPGLSGLAGCSDADPREPATDPQHQALGPDADRQGQREEHSHHSHGHRGPGREGFPDLGEPATRVHLGPLIPPAMWGFLGTQISRTVGRGAGRGLRCCLGHQKHYGTCQSQPSGIEIMVLVLFSPQRSRWGLAEGL